MFSKNKKLIISLSRNVLKAYFFLGSNKSPKEIGEYPWTVSNLEETLVKIKKESKDNKARILLSEDLGYLLDIDIPIGTKQERKYISQIVAERIPEKLEDDDWDFVETGKDKKNKKIRIFMPVQGIWQNFVQIARKIELEIEAVETIDLATKRNKDPIIGLGMKTDIKGKDEDVLNIVSSEMKKKEEEIFEENKLKEEPLKPKRKTALIIILIFLLFLLTGGGIYYYWEYIKKNPQVSTPQPLIPTITEVQATPTPKLDLKTLKINILNGSGKSGEAGKVKEYLQELEYNEIKTGNADSFDYTDINVSIKESKKEYKNRLIEDLSKNYKISETIGTLDNDNEYDAIIILGNY